MWSSQVYKIDNGKNKRNVAEVPFVFFHIFPKNTNPDLFSIILWLI